MKIRATIDFEFPYAGTLWPGRGAEDGYKKIVDDFVVGLTTITGVFGTVTTEYDVSVVKEEEAGNEQQPDR